jgi:hypothetical protein
MPCLRSQREGLLKPCPESGLCVSDRYSQPGERAVKLFARARVATYAEGSLLRTVMVNSKSTNPVSGSFHASLALLLTITLCSDLMT